MGNKFTQGPWRVEDDGRERLEITCDARKDRVAVAFVEVGFDEPFESEQEANARLLSAAPELFEALKILLKHVTSQHLSLEEQADGITKARAAISKAAAE